MSITIEGLDDPLAQILEELRLIREKLDQPTQGWFDIRSAARYLSASPGAVKSAERKGAIVASRSATGRVLFSKQSLDSYAQAGAR